MAPKLKPKPNGIYYVEFHDETGRRRISTGTRDKAVARKKMRDIVLGVSPATSLMPKAPKGAGHVTMRDLFDRAMKTVWAPSEAKSQATIISTVNILDPYIGDVPIQDMTYTRLEELVDKLKADKGYAPATIKRKLDMVSKALRMATKWTDDKGRPLLEAKPPMPTIRIANQKDRIVSRVEEVAIFNAIEARRQKEPGRQWFRMAALVRFLLDTGARLGEALGLTTDDVEERINGVTYVTFARYKTKNDKPRTIPLTPAAVAALDAMRPHLGKNKDGDWLFFPMKNGTAWYMFDQIRKDLKKEGFNLDDVVLHTFRHTALTRLAQGGMDLLRLQQWAGHSDPKITAERYTHLQPSDLDAGLDILGASNPTPGVVQGSRDTRPDNVSFTTEGANRAKLGTVSIN